VQNSLQPTFTHAQVCTLLIHAQIFHLAMPFGFSADCINHGWIQCTLHTHVHCIYVTIVTQRMWRHRYVGRRICFQFTDIRINVWVCLLSSPVPNSTCLATTLNFSVVVATKPKSKENMRTAFMLFFGRLSKFSKGVINNMGVVHLQVREHVVVITDSWN
jgi:hypothetical protein